ncbi:DUF2721 domain-containing protein [Sphingomonas oryzagri]
MAMPASLDAAARVVQLALTPIFLLAGLGTLLSVFSARLARIADRVDRLTEDPGANHLQLARLRLRSRLLDGAVLLGALSGAMTCCAALTLFLGVLGNAGSALLLFSLFGGALLCAVAALMVFSIETVLSGQTVRAEARAGALQPSMGSKTPPDRAVGQTT